MKNLTIGISYYKNPQTLSYQWKFLNQYDKSIHDRLEVIIVDDGSNLGFRAEELPIFREPIPFKCSIYRIIPDMAWNQAQARNIAAKFCSSDWFIYLDVDHFFMPEEIKKLMEMELQPEFLYYLNRRKHTTGEPNHPHKECRLLTKELFWKIGGFDESFSGIYVFPEWEMFKKRIEGKYGQSIIPVCLDRISSDLFHDSSTHGFLRKEGQDRSDYDKMVKWKTENNVGIQTLVHPFVKIL